MSKEQTVENVIVDLYEYRAKMAKPLSYQEVQSPHEVLQFNWLNVIISELTDKYDVRHEDIEAVMRERAMSQPIKS